MGEPVIEVTVSVALDTPADEGAGEPSPDESPDPLLVALEPPATERVPVTRRPRPVAEAPPVAQAKSPSAVAPVAAAGAPVLQVAASPVAAPPAADPPAAPPAAATPAAAPRISARYVRSPVARAAHIDLLAPLGGWRRRLPAVLFAGRVLNMAVMVALIGVGIGIASDAVALTNLTSFLVWNVWWPLLVVAVFVAARLWCGICHLRLTADIFDRFGLRLKVPRILKKYGTTIPLVTVLGIFVVHSVVVSYGVEDIPMFTAIFLLSLMVYAAVVGLVFEKHSFCKYFCPLVGVLGNYTRVSPTELRSSDLAVCKTCRDKGCIKNCQNKLYIGTMDDEQQESCLLCMRCVKHCPHDNIRFSPRPYFRGLWQSPKRTLTGAFAVVVMLGIVTGEVGENWPVVDAELLFVPGLLTRLAGFETILPVASGEGFLLWETLWVFILQPLIILAVCGLVAWALARKRNPLEYMQVYALGFIPLILSLHAAKLVTALNEAALYLPKALTDPRGVATADAIAAGELPAPAAMIASPTVWGWLMIAFVAGFGMLGSLYVTWRIARVSFVEAPRDGVRTAIPFSVTIAVLGVVAVLTIYTWLISGAGG